MMTATVVQLPKSIQRMVCSGCGAEANASCNCGKPYVPKAMRAAEAIRANPQKSDRAIAADLGVASNTVKAARDELRRAAQLRDGPRVGRDGKIRKIRNKPPPRGLTPLEEANAFSREIGDFIMDLQPRLHAWILANPGASRKVKDCIVNALFVTAERLQKFIQQIEDRESGGL